MGTTTSTKIDVIAAEVAHMERCLRHTEKERDEAIATRDREREAHDLQYEAMRRERDEARASIARQATEIAQRRGDLADLRFQLSALESGRNMLVAERDEWKRIADQHHTQNSILTGELTEARAECERRKLQPSYQRDEEMDRLIANVVALTIQREETSGTGHLTLDEFAIIAAAAKLAHCWLRRQGEGKT